jgi:hypothetical protein
MRRIIGGLKIRQVAAYASSRCAHKLVVLMTSRASNGGMRTGQWEAKGGVVNRGSQPACGRVA